MTHRQRNQFWIYFVNIALGLVYLSPLLWMLASSVKPESRIFSDMTRGILAFIPFESTLDNFKVVFHESNLVRCIWNSLFYVTVLVCLSLLVNSMCGYALAKFQFPGKNILFTIIIALFVLPLESIILALYWIVYKIGWNDTYRALVIPFAAKCFDI